MHGETRNKRERPGMNGNTRERPPTAPASAWLYDEFEVAMGVDSVAVGDVGGSVCHFENIVFGVEAEVGFGDGFPKGVSYGVIA